MCELIFVPESGFTNQQSFIVIGNAPSKMNEGETWTQPKYLH